VTAIEAVRVRWHMKRHPIFACSGHWTALLAVSGALVGCDSPTAPETLAVTVRTVELATEAERRAWPFTPIVQGGATVMVRGTASITCARPIGTVTRHANLIELHIAGDPAITICPANIGAWQPVEATILGLAPGGYRVRVTAVGHVGHAEWVVSVIQP
jgi:hypothetical protein